MNTSLSFTGPQIIVGLAVLFVGILAIIFIGRMYFDKKSDSGLAGKYQDKKWKSPLEARDKYPDVNVFKWSSLFFRLGLAISLGLIVAAFNWTSYEEEVFIPDGALELEVDLEVEPPRSSEPPPPPPPPPPPVIEEVPEGVVIEEEDFEFVDQSVSEESEILEAPVAMNTNEDAPPPPPPPPPPPKEEVEEIFKVVEDMPRFPGCENEPKDQREDCSKKKLLQFIYKNIKYPPIAKENGIEGTVVIQFVVDKNGDITEPTIVKDIAGQCGTEALRVVKLMNSMGEKWIPGKQRGRPVKVRYTLPVKFRLE